MKRNYIGLACTWHDPALAIVDSRGEVVFAEATERYLQKKRAHNCPPDDLVRISSLIETYCERDADLVVARTWTSKRAATDLVAFLLDFVLRMDSGRPKGRGALGAGVRRMPFARRPWISLMRFGLDAHRVSIRQASQALWWSIQAAHVDDHVARCRRAAGAVREQGLLTARLVPDREVYRVGYDHHLTHAAAACFASPYSEAVCAIVDGYAQHGSTGFFHYRDGRLEQLERRQVSWTSMGLLYGTLCTACGFDPMTGEEWKVMGLAPYGAFNQAIYDLLERALRVDDLKFVSARKAKRYGAFLAEIASFPAADLARTGQDFFERRMEELLQNLAKRGFSKNLVLGGGCALNSSANGKLLERTPFESLFVYCAPGDDGNAVGAAQLAYYQDHPEERPRPGPATPYLGSRMSAESLANTLRLGRPPGHRSWPGRVHERAAALLAEGKIVGWVQGRAEFGPRALGNRSILADPRRQDVKDALNERVKFREEFRPFAPSILHEHGPEYFEGYQESPYMERTLRFRPEVRERVPGVVHVDGTGRLQTVKREWNEPYYDLIAEFHRLTGVPLVLNTSFNVMGKPIIHTVEDALAVFYTSGLDALVIHDEVIEK